MASCCRKLRDYTVAYNEEELAGIRKEFAKLPTFDGKTFSTTDFQHALLNIAKVDRSSSQIQTYADYYDKKHGGRMTLDDAIDIGRAFSNPVEMGRKLAGLVDINKCGIIDAGEFQEIANLLSLHIGRRTSVTYDRFVKEADKDASNTVDIDECANWIGQYLTKQE